MSGSIPPQRSQLACSPGGQRHTLRMEYDVVYWYEYATRRKHIQELYVSEITALELCRSNEDELVQGSVQKCYKPLQYKSVLEQCR